MQLKLRQALLLAMSLNEATDGDEAPVAAAVLAQMQARARQALRKNCQVDLKADVPQL